MMNPPSTSQQPAQTQPVRASPELERYIQSVVEQALKANNQTKVWTDETITDESNLADLDKTPDIVRSIRDFSGDPREYTAWRKSVDAVFKLYGQLRGSAKYYGIICTVRSKVIGAANIALESHNTPLNWDAIKHYLNVHYADKRDIGTLEYQLTTMVQGNTSVDNFYHRVYGHLSLIINYISSMSLNRNTEDEFINSYRNKALDTFVRGLNGDLPRLLAMKEPTDLPQALHLCTKLANQNFRTSYANQRRTYDNAQFPPKPTGHMINNQRQYRPQFTQPNNKTLSYPNNSVQYMQPQLPIIQQRYINHQNPNQYQQNYQPTPFYQQLPPQNTYAPPRPTAPKPRNFEPMEVDHSIHSQMVNYANRPQIQQPNNRNNFIPSQHQQSLRPTRNFHLNTTTQGEDYYPVQPFSLTDIQNNTGDANEQSLSDYMQFYDNQYGNINEDNELVDVSDIHFLD